MLTDHPVDDCTIYYWKVAAIQDGGYGPFSDVGWFFTNEAGTCVLPYVPGLIGRNLNCRFGGWATSELLHIFDMGEIIRVVAVGPYGYYYALQIPGSGDTCWVVSDYVELWGDEEDLEVREVPQPTPTPLVCSADLPEDLCEEAGGEWTKSATHTGWYCKCP